jgi:hypothetical protein
LYGVCTRITLPHAFAIKLPKGQTELYRRDVDFEACTRWVEERVWHDAGFSFGIAHAYSGLDLHRELGLETTG